MLCYTNYYSIPVENSPSRGLQPPSAPWIRQCAYGWPYDRMGHESSIKAALWHNAWAHCCLFLAAVMGRRTSIEWILDH
jgi:hypothetical protein